MSDEKRYVVPDGMLKAAAEAWNAANEPSYSNEGVARITVEAALRWLAENPIEPEQEQARKLYADLPQGLLIDEITCWVVSEWQRRMFLAPEPEPEVPEAIQDLMSNPSPEIEKETTREIAEAQSHMHNRDVLEAYRRGQKAGTK